MSSPGGWAGQLTLNGSELAEAKALDFKRFARAVWDAHVSITLNPQATELTLDFCLEGEATGGDMVTTRRYLNDLAAFMVEGAHVETWWRGAGHPEPVFEWFGPLAAP